MPFLSPLFARLRRASSVIQSRSFSMDCSPLKSSGRYLFSPTLHWNSKLEEYFISAYGADQFAKISKALTRPSSYSCIRVNFLRATAEDIIKKLASFLNEIKFSDASIEKCPFPCLDYVIFVQGSGPHLMNYADISDAPLKEVIVSRKCAEAVLRGAQVFVPGVLACSSHVEKGDVVAVSVAIEQQKLDGEWCVGLTRGTVLQGLESDPQYHERKGLCIGLGVAMMSRAGIFRASGGIAVEMSRRIYTLPSFHNVLEGEIFLQNLPSIVTAHALDPREGERILDMCAAPGGKTTAIATLMRDKGEIIALDRSHNKVMAIEELSKEMGLTCIKAYKLDALRSVKIKEEDIEVDALAHSVHEISCNNARDTRTTEINGVSNSGKTKNGRGKSNGIGGRVESSKGFPPNYFDRVLLDAPCSALGLRPRLFSGEETMESLRNHAKYQKKMLEQAVQLVRPGGVLVYSTCTINPGENEAFVRHALDKYNFLSLAPQHPKIGGPGLVGGCELFNGEFTEKWLTEEEADLVQRFDPSSSIDTIGFFIAKFLVGRKDA